MTAAEKKLKLKSLAVAAVFTALICVISPLSLYIGPIPYSLATIPIFICGAFLSPAYAFGCSLCHLAIGAMGLPVFSNFSGGIGAVTGATGGYLFSFPLCALSVAVAVRIAGKRSVPALALGMLCGISVCYLCGTLYYSYLTGVPFFAAAATCVAPFIWWDIVKAVACVLFVVTAGKRIKL